MVKEKTQDTISQITKELFEHLSVVVQVVVNKEDDTFVIKVESEDGGMLIGYHGETLSALQLILSLLISKKLGSWQKILLDVDDYRQKRTESLKQMALQAAQQTIDENESIMMPYLSAYERRLVHLALANHPKVKTESEGEGRNRRIIIKLKEEKQK